MKVRMMTFMKTAIVLMRLPILITPFFIVLRVCTKARTQGCTLATIYGRFSEEKLSHQLDKMCVFATKFHGLVAWVSGAGLGQGCYAVKGKGLGIYWSIFR